MSTDETEERVREKAYELWLAEGCPDGRADAHWQMARELVASEDGSLDTPPPVGEPPLEPAPALESESASPGLADADENGPKPQRPGTIT